MSVENDIYGENECPRCGALRLKGWPELSDDEREVVRRLPQAPDYNLEERQRRHRWCTRCWFESLAGNDHTA